MVVEVKSRGTGDAVVGAIRQVLMYVAELKKDSGPLIPVVAVPYMTKFGRELCEKENVSWMDLSGNARITGKGLRIHISGNPNKYKTSGRPFNPFAPKSSRLTRLLLTHPDKSFLQKEIVNHTGIDKGHLSRVVKYLERVGLLLQGEDGAISPRDPSLLLDAWLNAYNFNDHHIIKGHVSSRSGEALQRQIADVLKNENAEYASTGLSAAWLYEPFAMFRTATVYLSKPPTDNLKQQLSFQEGERGSNTWLVVPKDQGVFHGVNEIQGINCVHPVQVYLDLKGHPERSGEAAEHLRKKYLNWSSDA